MRHRGRTKRLAPALAALLAVGCGDDKKPPTADAPEVSCQLQIAASLVQKQILLADGRLDAFSPAARPVSMPAIGWQAIFADGETALVYDVERRPWLYDAGADRWSDLSGQTAARADAALVRLPDGTLLITGGYDDERLDSAELYDPDTRAFTRVGPMSRPRTHHAAILLQDGTALIAGDGPFGEVYDPDGRVFTPTGAFPPDADARDAALLPDGRVLLVGTWEQSVAHIYDPAARAFTQVGPMRTEHSAFPTLTALADGRVLVAGGLVDRAPSALTELYDPVGNAFSPGPPMNDSRNGHGARLLPDGSVLVGGGLNDAGDFTDSAERFDPPSNSFVPLDGRLDGCRYDFAGLAF